MELIINIGLPAMPETNEWIKNNYRKLQYVAFKSIWFFGKAGVRNGLTWAETGVTN